MDGLARRGARAPLNQLTPLSAVALVMSKRVLIPLPDRDFDTTEVSVPWRLLTDAGHHVSFATARGGQPPACDPLLLTGVIFGQLGADPEPKRFYQALTQDPAFCAPLSWDTLDPDRFDALLLPGGHAPGMRPYLESEPLQRVVAQLWAAQKPVAAICHGVLVLARARDPEGRSLLHDRRTTCLPKYMERLAYYSTAWRLGRYYRTYPAYLQDEVCQSLADIAQFQRGPLTIGPRGTATDDRPAFVVEDGHYLSARWPGDAYLFARRFIAMLSAPNP
jgi:putative intracellular protease/amidase